jgi:hypothetical protein
MERETTIGGRRFVGKERSELLGRNNLLDFNADPIV